MQEIQQNQTNTVIEEPELTIQDYWLVINRGRLWIISSVLVMLAFAVYYNFAPTESEIQNPPHVRCGPFLPACGKLQS